MIKKSGFAIACVALIVACVTVSDAQTSDGTFALPSKVVLGQNGCSMSDIASQFINDRSTTCPQAQSHFFNGEVRFVDFGTSYIAGSEDTQNGYELTSCQCASNGTWTRTMSRVVNSTEDYIRWIWSFYARNSSCQLNLAQEVVVLGCFFPSEEPSCKCPAGFMCSADNDCIPITPIVIDLDGDGIKLSTRRGSVSFDLNSNDEKQQIPWTEGDSRDAWLVLNNKENGWIENGLQLFGDQSPQGPALSPTESENGYRALRGFDDNKDKQITESDGVWRLLAIWTDSNHNGVSDPGEIVSLTNAGIVAISLEYKESRRRDRHGNEFRYRAEVTLSNGKKVSSWDVLLTAP